MRQDENAPSRPELIPNKRLLTMNEQPHLMKQRPFKQHHGLKLGRISRHSIDPSLEAADINSDMQLLSVMSCKQETSDKNLILKYTNTFKNREYFERRNHGRLKSLPTLKMKPTNL